MTSYKIDISKMRLD
uniref:Uncharacterized protein n=1 Tax=Amphimedon queenslandica TaxID=400682 RepID=A0A1X7T376_AMPQE